MGLEEALKLVGPAMLGGLTGFIGGVKWMRSSTIYRITAIGHRVDENRSHIDGLDKKLYGFELLRDRDERTMQSLQDSIVKMKDKLDGDFATLRKDIDDKLDSIRLGIREDIAAAINTRKGES